MDAVSRDIDVFCFTAWLQSPERRPNLAQICSFIAILSRVEKTCGYTKAEAGKLYVAGGANKG
jgi:hypothetical protein